MVEQATVRFRGAVLFSFHSFFHCHIFSSLGKTGKKTCKRERETNEIIFTDTTSIGFGSQIR